MSYIKNHLIIVGKMIKVIKKNFNSIVQKFNNQEEINPHSQNELHDYNLKENLEKVSFIKNYRAIAV